MLTEWNNPIQKSSSISQEWGTVQIQKGRKYNWRCIQIIVPLSMYNLHIRERTKSNAYWNKIKLREAGGNANLVLVYNRLSGGQWWWKEWGDHFMNVWWHEDEVTDHSEVNQWGWTMDETQPAPNTPRTKLDSGKTGLDLKISPHAEKNVSPESQPVSHKRDQITCEGVISPCRCHTKGHWKPQKNDIFSLLLQSQ